MSQPLPVAVLLRRSRNAKSAKDLHDTAYFAWEVSVRLGVAARPPTDRTALRAASLGAWTAALEVPDASFDHPALREAYACLVREGSGRAAHPAKVHARGLIDALPAYRNRVIGHGSVRSNSFYAQAGAQLLHGLEAAWSSGIFTLGGRIVYVETVEIQAQDARRARVLDLMGDHVLVVDPAGILVPADVLPQRVYLWNESTWQPLHPWVLFFEDAGAERVFCFDAIHGQSARYLDYASGEHLRGARLEARTPGIGVDLRSCLGVRADGTGEPAVKESASDFGAYRLLGEIGRGGMGVVHLARQEELDRLVALKVLPETLLSDATARARFEREIQALARCDHPSVIRILGSGTTRGQPWYAMEYVEGADLDRVADRIAQGDPVETAIRRASHDVATERAALLGREAPPPPADAPAGAANRPRRLAALARDAARGLHHLHEQGVLHRDIKPSNLLVTAHDHRAVVMDLGLARLAGASQDLTQTAEVMGTLRFLAPEQVTRPTEGVDRRVDVYALGATLHELLTGRPFLDGDTPARVLEQVLRARPPSVDRADPRVPADLATIVAKATAKDPDARYGSAAALGDDLDAFLDDRPIAARPTTLRYVLRLAARRHRAAAAGLVFALLTVVAGAAWLIKHLDDLGKREAALRATAEQDRTHAMQLADRMLGEVQRIPAGEAEEAVERIAAPILAYYGDTDVESLDEDQLRRHGQAFDWIARTLMQQNDPAGAWPFRRRCRAILGEFVRRRPRDAAARAWLAETQLEEGIVAQSLGDERAADEAWQTAVATARMTPLSDVSEEQLRQLGQRLDGLADRLQASGDHATSLMLRDVFRTMLVEQLRRRPASWSYGEALLWCLVNAGDSLRDLGDWRSAVERWREAQAVRRRRLQARPDDLDLVQQLHEQDLAIAEQLAKHGRADEALELYRGARTGLEELLERKPASADLRSSLADAHDGLGGLLEEQGETRAAEAHWAAAKRLRGGP